MQIFKFELQTFMLIIMSIAHSWKEIKIRFTYLS